VRRAHTRGYLRAQQMIPHSLKSSGVLALILRQDSQLGGHILIHNTHTQTHTHTHTHTHAEEAMKRKDSGCIGMDERAVTVEV
jgi:hypothetical protein